MNLVTMEMEIEARINEVDLKEIGSFCLEKKRDLVEHLSKERRIQWELMLAEMAFWSLENGEQFKGVDVCEPIVDVCWLVG